MNTSIKIITPDKVHLEYDLAEIGTRAGAYLIDLLFQGIILLAIILSFVGLSMFKVDIVSSEVMIAFWLLVSFLLKWFYFVFFEAVMNGQSPGKKAMRIRVINKNGDFLDLPTIIFRNFLRIIDGQPGIPLLGGFIAMVNKDRQRLGDMISQTVVVQEIDFDLKFPESRTRIEYTTDDSMQLSKRLSEEELYIIRKFLNNKQALPFNRVEEVSQKLADKLQQKLEVKRKGENNIEFIERIYLAHK